MRDSDQVLLFSFRSTPRLGCFALKWPWSGPGVAPGLPCSSLLGGFRLSARQTQTFSDTTPDGERGELFRLPTLAATCPTSADQCLPSLPSTLLNAPAVRDARELTGIFCLSHLGTRFTLQITTHLNWKPRKRKNIWNNLSKHP
jgi:hypothetical protein